MCCEFEEVERETELNLEIYLYKSEEVKSFKYLWSVVQNNGDLDEETTGRIQTRWNSWGKCSGMLCDQRMPIKLKGKI